MRLFMMVVIGVIYSAHLASAGPTKVACSTELHCAQLCSPKNKAACDRLDEQLDELTADIERRTVKKPHDFELPMFELARASTTAACKAKYTPACVTLGRIENALQIAVGDDRWDAACSAKIGLGCYATGMALKRGKLLPEANLKFKAGCQAKHKPSCYQALVTTSGNDASLPPLIETECKGGNGEACWMLSLMFERGVAGVAKDAAKSGTHRAQSCKLGFRLACENLAKAAPDDTKRLSYLRMGCEAGTHRHSCTSAIKVAEKLKDASATTALRERACELGDLFECGTLELAASNDKTAKRWRDAICAGGADSNCASLYESKLPEENPMNEPRPWVYPEPAKVAKLLAEMTARCNAGHLTLCGSVALIYASGFRTKRDLKKARDFAKKQCPAADCTVPEEIEVQETRAKAVSACATGDAKGCDEALAYMWGPDRVPNMTALENACTGKVEYACHLVAIAKLRNGDVTQLAAVDAACVAGTMQSCHDAINVLQTSNPARALELTRVTCEKGDAFGCELIGDRLAAAQPPDTAGAIDAYTKACTLDAKAPACGKKDKLAGKVKAPSTTKPSPTAGSGSKKP